jgi:uncharacterized membrane protein
VIVPMGVGYNRAHDLNNEGQVVGETPIPGTNTLQAYLLNPLDTNGDGQPDTWFLDADSDGQNDLITGLGGVSNAHAVNDAGQVLGLVADPGVTGQLCLLDPLDTDNDGRPDCWFVDSDNDGFNDLVVPLGRPAGLGASYAIWTPYADLNDLGQVIVSYHDTDGVSPDVGFLLTPQVDENGVRQWSVDDGSGANGLWVSLGTFWPTAINDKGQIAGSALSASGAPTAALMTPDGSVIELKVGGTFSFAPAINNRGQISVYRAVDTAGQPDEHAGLITPLDTDNDGIADTWCRDANGDGINDLIVDLGTYKRMEQSIAYTHGLNEAGTVLGLSSTYAHHFYDASAWLWQNGVLQSLQDLTGATLIQSADAINDAGQIICFDNDLQTVCILLPTH